MSVLQACRSCSAGALEDVLSLGVTPLANSLLTAAQLREPEPRFPLDLAFCPACSLVQITETVPPEQLFREYLYFSSFSDTMLRHAEASARTLIDRHRLGPESLVLEIASNDGYFLQYFAREGVPVLGVEPARNIAAVAADRGIPTVSEFFGRELAESLAAEGRRADVILANNVMAHIPDINGVAAGIKTLLKPGGVFVMETPYVRDMVEKLEFDTIYHEHLFYYSLTALEALFRRHGLAVAAAERISIHGGSLRVSVVHAGEAGEGGGAVALLGEERALGVDASPFYRSFAARVEGLGRDLRALLGRLKAEGASIAAYGAAAKGSTLLNYIRVGTELLDFAADRSPHKQGLHMPGVHLPIAPPERLLEAQPDYLLLLAWNFADEIMAQQAEYARRGGRFIIPLPHPTIV